MLILQMRNGLWLNAKQISQEQNVYTNIDSYVILLNKPCFEEATSSVQSGATAVDKTNNVALRKVAKKNKKKNTYAVSEG